MDFRLTKEQLLVRKMVREFAENEVKPIASEIDEEERFPAETVEKMAKLGMMGIYFPKEYGGAGGDVLSYAITVEELADVRCAVSEAVTNAIVHAYRESTSRRGARATVYILITLYDDRSVKIVIRDKGCGIADLHRAMEPQYTSDDTGERSGMGFAIMQSFMDCVRVRSAPGKGTTVELRKTFALRDAADSCTAEPPSGEEDACLRCEAEEIA